MKFILAIIVMLIGLCGCIPFGGFKSPPDAFDEWSKPQTSVLEVSKALLECGMVNIHSYPLYIKGEPVKQARNENLLAERCMVNAGFIYNGDFGVCTYKPDQLQPACQPDAIIPSRSVERRLNSPYCKQYPHTFACQPPEQGTTPQNESTLPQNKNLNTYVPPNSNYDQSIRLQRDMQNQSNSQMNNMLKNTAPKMGR
jgi:hypothetical protein